VLKHCAATKKRWLTALPDVGPYIYICIYTTLKFLALQRAPYIYIYSYIYNIGMLRFKCKRSFLHSRDQAVRGQIPVLVLCTTPTWSWIICLTFRQLYPWETNLSYILNRRFGGPQGRSWPFGAKKIFLISPGTEPLFLERLRYLIWYIYIFNGSWVGTRWQQYITHLHTTVRIIQR
jgi:hypothetical protein